MNPDLPEAITDHRLGGVLEIRWADGQVSRLGHPMLRARCRCATCEQQRRQGEAMPAADAGVRLVQMHAVGLQGLNLQFSDGHGRGIYPWAYLRQLARL